MPAPCVGVVFLYPYSQVESRKKRLGAERGSAVPGVWFMDQTIGNACGAVALMHTVMNCMDVVSKDSTFLQKFKNDAKSANARERGDIFGSALRGLHDEVSGRGQTEAPKPNADLDFHFISIVQVNGILYACLLQPFPPRHVVCPPPPTSTALLTLSCGATWQV